MKTYIIDYVVGNTYKTKRVRAESVEQACKKARLNKSIIDIQIEGNNVERGFSND